MLSTTTIDNLLLIVILYLRFINDQEEYSRYVIFIILWTPCVGFFLNEGTIFAGISQVTAHTKIFCHTRGDAGPATTTTTATTTTMRGARTRAGWVVGGWHQVPQEHLILISFAPTLWPTTWRSGISDRIRSQSLLRLSGRNTQKAVNAGGERERVRLRQTEWYESGRGKGRQCRWPG